MTGLHLSSILITSTCISGPLKNNIVRGIVVRADGEEERFYLNCGNNEHIPFNFWTVLTLLFLHSLFYVQEASSVTSRWLPIQMFLLWNLAKILLSMIRWVEWISHCTSWRPPKRSGRMSKAPWVLKSRSRRRIHLEWQIGSGDALLQVISCTERRTHKYWLTVDIIYNIQ